MRILVVDDDPDVREVLIFFLEVQLEAEYLESATIKDSLEILKQEAPVDLVLCDYHLKGETGSQLFTQMKAAKLQIPFVLASGKNREEVEDIQSNELAYYLRKPFNNETVSTMVREVLNPKDVAESLLIDKEYVPVRVKRFLQDQPLPCDIFVKLSEDKYVRVLKTGELFTNKDQQHFSGKDLAHLYVHKDSAPALIRQITNNLLQRYSGDEVSVEDLTHISADCMRTIRNMSETLGFNEELMHLTTASVEIAMHTISKNSNAKKLLDKRLMNSEHYLASHSLMLAHFACGLGKLLNWEYENQDLKLTSAALLHDLYLSHDHWEREGRRPSSATFIEDDTPPDEIEFIRHIKKAAATSKEIRELPNEVEQLITEHHEMPDGSGFPRALDASKLGALSSLFIFSHHFINWVFQHDSDSDQLLQEYLEKHEQLYSSYHFRDILSYLRRMLMEKQNSDSTENQAA